MYNYERRLEQLSEQLKLYGLDYLALVPGANLTYFAGLTMALSERPTVAFFPERSPALAKVTGAMQMAQRILFFWRDSRAIR